MKHSTPSFLLIPIFLFTVLLNACSGQEEAQARAQPTITTPTKTEPTAPPQIAEYIRHIYQDKNGGFWFGTNGYGAAHYTGDSIVYFSPKEGFNGLQITGITEDNDKNIWFATDSGIVKYDWSENAAGEKQFTNYFNQYLLGNKRFWSIFADSKNNIWAGSVNGIFKFDGDKWTPFPLPSPDADKADFISKSTTWGITEDQEGNIWFSTNGFGAFKYHGDAFTQYTKRDGLTDDRVDDILAASNGDMWFGTRYGGVSRYDGKTFTNYTAQNTIGDNEVCSVFEDREGNIWFSSEGFGVYRYDGKSFTNFGEDQGLGVRAVQTIFQDTDDRIWVGGGGGLYRFDGTAFFQVMADGPWD